MGFTDIVQGARQGLSDSMGRRTQKRENSLDRLQTALGRLSGMKQQTSEREAAQEHEAFLQQQSQAAATALQGAGDTAAMERQEAGDAAAFARIAETGRVEEGVIGARTEAEQSLQDDMQEFQETLQGTQDEAAMARLQAGIDADLAAAERAFVQPREEYDPRTDTVNGRTYSWKSDQEYELVKLQMQRDMIMDQIRLEAELTDKYGDQANNYIPLYMQARDMVMADFQAQGLWDGQNWMGLPTKEQRDAAIQRFSDMVNRDARYALFAEDMISDFTKYVDQATVPEGGDVADGGDPSLSYWTNYLQNPPTITGSDVRESTAENMQEGGPLSLYSLSGGLFAGANPFIHSQPPPVTQEVEDYFTTMIDQLLGKAQSLGETQTLQGYKDQITADGMIGRDPLNTIITALRRLGVNINE